MADEMDTCEYIWNHELAMRRLLSLLRNGQSYCTDAECVDLPANSYTQDADTSGNQFLWTFIVIVMALLLFVLRPSRTRRTEANGANDKPPPAPSAHHDGGSGSGGGGGPPSPAIH